MPLAIETARWFVAGLFLLVLTVASVSDIRRRRIPNWTVIAIIALFVPWIFVGPAVSVPQSLAAFAVLFAVGTVLYALGLWGAGDAKLIAAVGLFVGWKGLLGFAVVTALSGGIMALIVILSNSTRVLVMLNMRGQADFGRTVPYGVAIALGSAAIVFGGLLGSRIPL